MIYFMIIALTTYAIDPTFRPEQSATLYMISCNTDKVALFDDSWYKQGDTIAKGNLKILEIDCQSGKVVVEDNSSSRTLYLWQ